MVKNKIRYHPNKWTGVYVYELDELSKGRQDLCFYINFRQGRRLVWEKVGKLSEGYSAPVAAEIRAKGKTISFLKRNLGIVSHLFPEYW